LAVVRPPISDRALAKRLEQPAGEASNWRDQLDDTWEGKMSPEEIVDLGQALQKARESTNPGIVRKDVGTGFYPLTEWVDLQWCVDMVLTGCNTTKGPLTEPNSDSAHNLRRPMRSATPTIRTLNTP
jgi:hypothetical protein